MNKNINSHIEAQLALMEGKKIRNIRYTDNEYIFLNLAQGQISTEKGYLCGGFNDMFWQRQKQLPERWHIVD